MTNKSKEKVKETEFLLPMAMAEKIANYLARQPYGEVAGLIGGMQSLKISGAASEPEKVTNIKKAKAG